MYLSLQISVVIHESSHIGVAAALGGHVLGIHVPWFGDGYGDFTFPDSVGRFPRFASQIAGPTSQIVIGTVALLLSRRAPTRRPKTIFAVYASVSLLFGLQYLGAGLYYFFGDPGDAMVVLFPPCATDSLRVVSQIGAAATLAAIGVASYYLMRSFLEAQELWHPTSTRTARFWVLMTTALPAAAIFLTLYIWAGGSPDFFLTGDSRWNVPARDFQIEQNMDALGPPEGSPAERCQMAVNRYADHPISQRIDARSLAIDEMRSQGRSPESGTRPPLLPASLAAVAVGSVFGFIRTRKTKEV